MRESLAVLTAIALITAGFAAVPGMAYSHRDGQDDRNASDGQGDAGGHQDGRDGDRGADKRPDRAMSAEERRTWAQDKRQQALDRAENAGLFGQLSYEEGQVAGTFVEATLDEETGAVSDHTLLGNDSHTVLTSFEPDAEVDGDVETRPATATVSFEDGELRLHDNPTGLLQYRSTAPASVSIDVSDGYDVNLNENETRARLTGAVNASILLGGEGSLDVDGSSVQATIDEAGTVLFQAQPDEPGQQVSQRALEHAAEAGRLGGEVRVSGAGGEAVDQDTPVDVNMSAQYASNGQAIVELDGDVDEGRVVNLKIAKDNLPVNGTEEIVPKLDREEIPRAASIDEVVNATGGDPVAHVDVQQRIVEVTIWVPEFSLHSVNVQDATQDVSDLPQPLDATNPSGLDIDLAEQSRQRALSQAQAWDQLGPQAQTQATANAQQAGLFGQANLQAGALQGAHVQASLDADTGVLEDYRLVDRATPASLFDEIRPSEFTPAEDVQEMGPAIALPGEEVAIIAHDTPTGHLELKAGEEATHVDLDMASDVEVDRVDEHRLKLTTPTGLEVHVAIVAGDGDLMVEGDTIVANLGANAAVQTLAQPGQQVPGEANLEERVQAAAGGNLGAEASITAVDGTPVEDRVETSVELETSEVNEAEGSITVQATSQVPDPRAITLNLDPALVGEVPAEEIAVLVDGEPIQAAADAEAVLQAGEAQASFHAEQAGDGLQVLVNLDGFSEHDVTVQSQEDTDGTDDGDTDDTTDNETQDGDDSEENGTPFPPAVLVIAVVGLLAVLRREG